MFSTIKGRRLGSFLFHLVIFSWHNTMEEQFYSKQPKTIINFFLSKLSKHRHEKFLRTFCLQSN